MQILDTLADGRQLVRVEHSLASVVQPGQWLQHQHKCWRVFRHHREQHTLDLVCDRNEAIPGDCQLGGRVITAPTSDTALLVCRDDAIFSVLHFLAQMNGNERRAYGVIAAFTSAMPFRPCPSRLLSPQLPGHVMAALPLLEDWGVFSRLTHPSAPGCFDGDIDALVAALCQSTPVIHVE